MQAKQTEVEDPPEVTQEQQQEDIEQAIAEPRDAATDKAVAGAIDSHCESGTLVARSILRWGLHCRWLGSLGTGPLEVTGTSNSRELTVELR